MYDRILVPTDGSDAAQRAVEWGFALAETFDASLHLITVLEHGELPAAVQSEASEPLAQFGRETVDKAADRADSQVSTTTASIDSEGPVHEAIIDYGTEHDVDLVVMGTHGRTGLDRLILGSVAERTLRLSPVPVLTVHDDTPVDPDIDRVLFPTDGSETARTAGEHATRLAAETGAALHVVHVVDLTVVPTDGTSGAIVDALEDVGRRAVDDAIERAQGSGVGTVEASLLSGTPARAIVDYVTERDVDVVMMGTHGRSGLERYLIGSVTEKVVRLADVPVVSISPGDESR